MNLSSPFSKRRLPSATLPPVIVGATGGSGTRAVASILQQADVFLGSRPTASKDARSFTKFTKTWAAELVGRQLSGRDRAPRALKADFRRCIEIHVAEAPSLNVPWGWKHPHMYLLLPFLEQVVPGFRFVHVVRDGRDMAFSSNQRQPARYGGVVFGETFDSWPSHLRAARFWAWANDQAADYGESAMGQRYLRLRFEDLCDRPDTSVRALIEFARAEAVSEERVSLAAGEVAPPPARQVTPELAGQAREACAGALRRFGYI